MIHHMSWFIMMFHNKNALLRFGFYSGQNSKAFDFVGPIIIRLKDHNPSSSRKWKKIYTFSLQACPAFAVPPAVMLKLQDFAFFVGFVRSAALHSRNGVNSYSFLLGRRCPAVSN